MRENPLILIVEDEPRVSRYLRSSLQMSGYDALVAPDGVKALELTQENRPDLVLLDLRLPRMGGLEVLENIRRVSDVPIIVLTANDSEEDKVRALMLGADDYVTKPFGARELQARIVAVLRRYRSAETAAPRATIYENKDLRIDYAARQVTINGKAVHLTPTEYRLLVTMAENTNRVLTHDYLLARVWGAEYADDVHILRATIWRLRQKVESDPTNPKYILNEPGVGYRLQRLTPDSESTEV
ncbi:MAG: response regulator transcription factor [Chloroflexi bacterium]|nr:response regulator transcription factor [Chloroflexota bacterium]